MLQQQMQAQHLPHAHAPTIPMPPHPGGLPPGLPPGSSGILGLAGASGLIAGHLPGVKDEKGLYTNGKVAKLHLKSQLLHELFKIANI